MTDSVVVNEIHHGEQLAAGDTEKLWGWGTPAGRLRAERRGRLISEGGHLGPGKRVLEIGCGTGLFTEMFAVTGASVLAVDLSAKLLAKARMRRLPADRIFFLEKPFEECSVDGPFDAVIGSSVLHHLDMSRALPKIFDLLKPGGFFSFAEPNMLNPQVWAERHFRRFFPHISPDETAFIRKQLENDMACCGFSEIRATPFDWLHPAVPPSCISAILSLGSCLEKVPLFREFSGSLLITAKKPISFKA